jgi:single-stranded-DNA-specific exonuclease
VVERYGRPALVVARDGDGRAYGSGRSIRRFHLLEALESCRELLTRFGGHAYAVGFALRSDRIGELAIRLDQFARTRLKPEDLEPALELDAELKLEEINPNLLAGLQKLAPFGVGNPEPRFAARGVRLLVPPRVLKEKHLKLKFAIEPNGTQKFVRAMDALGWRMGEQCASFAAGDIVDSAFTIAENTHPEFGGIQLNLLDLQKAAGAAVAAQTS